MKIQKPNSNSVIIFAAAAAALFVAGCAEMAGAPTGTLAFTLPPMGKVVSRSGTQDDWCLC